MKSSVKFLLPFLLVFVSSVMAGGQIFDSPMLYHSRPNSGDIEVGDFNDDGILDIAHGQLYSDLIMFHIGNGDGTFQSLYPYYIYNYTEPDYIAIGDLNNDGLDDMAVLANNLTSDLKIYFSDSASNAIPNLSETPVFYIFSGENVSYLELADEDNDGWLDILLGGFDNTMAMYNNHDETFSDRTDIGAGINYELVNADLNKDGYIDFVSRYTNATIDVTLSDGIGGYHTTTSVNAVGTVFSTPILADMTGDGELDAVYTGTGGGYTGYWVEVAVNQGDGIFGEGVRYDILPEGYMFFSVGNFFGDSYNDIAAVHFDNYTHAIINNIGNLNFDPFVEYPADHRPVQPKCYDFNGDGYDDLLSRAWTALGVYLNHGDGTFPTTADYFELQDFYNMLMIKEMTTADFNGDGYPDAAVFGQYGSGVTFTGHYLHLYYNDGAGNIGATDNLITLLWVEYWKNDETDYLITGDFIGDSAVDLVVCGDDNYRIYTGPLQSAGTYYGDNFTILGNPVGLAADVDRDNDLDLVLSAGGDFLVKYYENGVHTLDTTFLDVVSQVSLAVDTLDLDNDGDLDFVSISAGNNCYTVENDGSGNLSALQTISILPSTGQGALVDIVAADFNNDGYGDAAVLLDSAQGSTSGLVDTAVVYILMNDGAGNLAVDNSYHYIESAKKIQTADFDNDGDFDLALCAAYPKGVAILLNDGNGSFDKTGLNYAVLSPGGQVIEISANDFDLDGNCDIAVLQKDDVDTYGTITMLWNTGNAASDCDDPDDFDTDGIGNICDNCPHIQNTQQIDSDGNGYGDSCQFAEHTPIGTPSSILFDIGISVAYTSVTTAGSTYVTIGPLGGLSEEHSIIPAAIPAYVNITTDAIYTGPIDICINYPNEFTGGVDEFELVLIHHQNGKWNDITTSLDTATNTLCGTINHLSPFAIAIPGAITAVGNDEWTVLPLKFSLDQNYPNPFNPSTVIKYTLAHRADVELTIFNILGQSVRTLVNENLAAGDHTVVWNGLNEQGEKVSSGIYFYRIKTDDYVQSRKMILLK